MLQAGREAPGRGTPYRMIEDREQEAGNTFVLNLLTAERVPAKGSAGEDHVQPANTK